MVLHIVGASAARRRRCDEVCTYAAAGARLLRVACPSGCVLAVGGARGRGVCAVLGLPCGARRLCVCRPGKSPIEMRA